MCLSSVYVTTGYQPQPGVASGSMPPLISQAPVVWNPERTEPVTTLPPWPAARLDLHALHSATKSLTMLLDFRAIGHGSGEGRIRRGTVTRDSGAVI